MLNLIGILQKFVKCYSRSSPVVSFTSRHQQHQTGTIVKSIEPWCGLSVHHSKNTNHHQGFWKQGPSLLHETNRKHIEWKRHTCRGIVTMHCFDWYQMLHTFLVDNLVNLVIKIGPTTHESIRPSLAQSEQDSTQKTGEYKEDEECNMSVRPRLREEGQRDTSKWTGKSLKLWHAMFTSKFHHYSYCIGHSQRTHTRKMTNCRQRLKATKYNSTSSKQNGASCPMPYLCKSLSW